MLFSTSVNMVLLYRTYSLVYRSHDLVRRYDLYDCQFYSQQNIKQNFYYYQMKFMNCIIKMSYDIHMLMIDQNSLSTRFHINKLIQNCYSFRINLTDTPLRLIKSVYWRFLNQRTLYYLRFNYTHMSALTLR